MNDVKIVMEGLVLVLGDISLELRELINAIKSLKEETAGVRKGVEGIIEELQWAEDEWLIIKNKKWQDR